MVIFPEEITYSTIPGSKMWPPAEGHAHTLSRLAFRRVASHLIIVSSGLVPHSSFRISHLASRQMNMARERKMGGVRHFLIKNIEKVVLSRTRKNQFASSSEKAAFQGTSGEQK